MRLREKIGYGLGDTASSMLWKLFSVYLMFFYTDICGIDAWVVGVLFLVTRIWDSLLDPVVGLLCDRTSSPRLIQNNHSGIIGNGLSDLTHLPL